MKFVDNLAAFTVPQKLYKYYGNFEYAFLALKNKGVFLDKPSNFNDPFDELYVPIHVGSTKYKTWVTFQEIINYYLSNEEYLEKYWGEIDFTKTCNEIFQGNYDWIIEVKDAVNEFIKVSGFDKISAEKVINSITNKRFRPYININDDILKVSCFCETNTSIPMWAYYGHNHTGLCLEYDISLLKDSQYVKHFFPITYTQDRDNENVHFHKSAEWQHEKEWRVIVSDFEDDYLPLDCVSAIYFGERFDFSDNSFEKCIWYKPKSFQKKKYDLYCSLIDEVKKSNHPIKLYKSVADLNKYQLNFYEFFEHKGGEPDEV